MTETTPDRIEKTILLRAPVSRVWRALTDAREFGAWFGVKLEGDFAAGKPASGSHLHPGYEHLTMTVTVERMDAERLFSFRWHPNAVDPDVDYSTQPTTLVEFRLEEVAEGTLLTLVVCGFGGIAAKGRTEAYRGNSEGWAIQLENIRRHVDG